MIYEPEGGEMITDTAHRMVAMAQNRKTFVTAEFNGIELCATADSNPDEIVRRFHAEMERRAEEYRASPEGIAAEARRLEHERIAKEAEAEGVLPFNTIDADGWAKTVAANDDPYGACGVRFAARWANYMEREMANGASLKDIADTASHEADKEGIAGFMYGCAVSVLSKVWKHGEELRRWHNLKTQIGNEGERANESGGTLNPALLSIG
jgi:hypothetical protein